MTAIHYPHVESRIVRVHVLVTVKGEREFSVQWADADVIPDLTADATQEFVERVITNLLRRQYEPELDRPTDECPAGGAHEWVRERFGSAVHCDHCGASAEREPVVGGTRWEHDPQTGEWVRVSTRQPDPCTGDEVPF